MTLLTERAVQDAADRLVAAFAATDTVGYFACFSPEATFVFHTEPARLNSRAEYERVWAEWKAADWSIESCGSTDRLIQLFGDVAVFSHRVHTVSVTAGERATYDERESIVFAVDGDDVVAVHEQLSPEPSPSQEAR